MDRLTRSARRLQLTAHFGLVTLVRAQAATTIGRATLLSVTSMVRGIIRAARLMRQGLGGILRAFRKKTGESFMEWPTIAQISTLAPLPDGYHYEKLSPADVLPLIAGIRRWHPDIAVGGGSCYLREAFYNASVCLGDDTKKDVFVCVFKRADELVGMWSWERIPDTRSMYGRLIVIAPEHRSAKLASQVMPLAVTAGRAMGAEFLFGLATLRIPHMQNALEKAGFQLIGFTSGYDCEEVAPGDIRRVFEGVYCKVLVPEDELMRPDPANLTPRARALFDVLFPQPSAAAQL